MFRKIFVNLPVKDLDRSKQFFSSQDPDGHIWELAYMDPSVANGGQA